MSSGRSRKRSKIAGGARKVGLKPVKPTAGLKPVKKTPSTPTPRYVAEIRNILLLLMKNKASMPFKQVPAAPDYRSLLKDALCLNVMQAKAARNPCGYSNFKEFDNDMKLLHRQEMKYDNKVSSALSAKRKSRMEILKGYYDTLSRSYLAHGPNLSPNTKTASAGGGTANTSKSTSTTTTTTSVTTVSSTTSTTSTNANSGSTQAPPGSVKKIKATKITANVAARKKTGKDGVINLTDDSPPAVTPVATKKITLAGRKRTLSNQMKEETKEDKPPQKKIRLENKSAVNKTKTTVTSNVTKTKTKAKAKTKTAEESKHIEIDEPLTQPPSQPSQTSTQEEDVKMVEVTSKKTKIQRSGVLTTPVSRGGFNFATPSSSKSAKTKSTKKKTTQNVPATFLEMASSYALISGGKGGSGSVSTGKTKSSTTTTTTTTTVTTSSSSSSSSSRTTSLLDTIKKNTKEPTSSFSQTFSLDSLKTRNEKKPGNSRILKDTVVETKRGKEEMDVDAMSDSDLPPRFQGGYEGSRYESAMRMVSRGEFSFDDTPYTTPKTTIRSYTFSDDDGEDVHGANNMRSSYASRFTSSRVGSSSLLSSNNLTGRTRMREYMFDDDDIEMESTEQPKWSRYELTIEVQSPLSQRWKRRTVERDGSDIEKVVQRYFDINSHETMRLVGARFLRNVANF